MVFHQYLSPPSLLLPYSAEKSNNVANDHRHELINWPFPVPSMLYSEIFSQPASILKGSSTSSLLTLSFLSSVSLFYDENGRPLDEVIVSSPSACPHQSVFHSLFLLSRTNYLCSVNTPTGLCPTSPQTIFRYFFFNFTSPFENTMSPLFSQSSVPLCDKPLSCQYCIKVGNNNLPHLKLKSVSCQFKYHFSFTHKLNVDQCKIDTTVVTILSKALLTWGFHLP